MTLNRRLHSQVALRMAKAIANSDLPALYQAADEASVDAQRKYLSLVKADLIVLLAGAFFASFDVDDVSAHKILLILSAALLATGAIITIVISQKTYKKRWYGGRAVAESVKTLAWRFMMRAEPFDDADARETVDEKFTRSLREVLFEGANLTLTLPNTISSARQITDRMREVRLSELDARKAIYVRDRIDDQQGWYYSKSSANASREELWFWLVAGAQLLALLAAIAMVAFPDVWGNPTGVFATIAAAGLAWLQVKQHEELSQSYAVAAQELGLIAEQARYATDEAKFSVFVADAETAISREHTLWLARRDQLLAITPSQSLRGSK